MPFEYYPPKIPRQIYDDARTARREKMFEMMGVHPKMRVDDTDNKFSTLIDRLSGLLDSHVSMKMMGITVTLKSITAGRLNFLWMTCVQGEERYVCCVWPRPMFSEGVVHYATSETFIDRVRMTMMMVDEDQLDFS